MPENIKPTILRIKKSTWVYLKKKAIDREMSLNSLIVELLEKYKDKGEKKLTNTDILIS
jgi:hypothetical protein